MDAIIENIRTIEQDIAELKREYDGTKKKMKKTRANIFKKIEKLKDRLREKT